MHKPVRLKCSGSYGSLDIAFTSQVYGRGRARTRARTCTRANYISYSFGIPENYEIKFCDCILAARSSAEAEKVGFVPWTSSPILMSYEGELMAQFLHVITQ